MIDTPAPQTVPLRRGASQPAWMVGLVVAAVFAATSLVAGVGGGLVRIGAVAAQAAGPAGPAAAAWHGAVMVCGLFGTLIALERAVALKRGAWVPLLAGAGALAAWLGAPREGPLAAWTLAGAGLVALYAHAGRTRAWSLHLAVELGGAVAWLAGTLAWAAGWRDAALVGWCGFLVLTIAGERRELTQMRRLSRAARVAFVAVVAMVPVAFAWAVATAVAGGPGAAAPAAAWAWWGGCGALALWLLRFDFAPRQRHAAGWAGHTAWNLSVGYAWLAIAALVGLAQGRLDGAALHLLLLGFVFAMVFGHAPIILPALTGLRPRYTPWARVPLAVMAASLAMRAWGDATGSAAARAWAGTGHALAIALFASTMALAVWHGRERRR